MSTYKSINPHNNELLKEFPLNTESDIIKSLYTGGQIFQNYKKTSFDYRSQLLKNLSRQLKINREKLARLISLEMGKVLSQSLNEIDKCAACADYFADNGASYLKDEEIKSGFSLSKVSYESLGVIFGVMPWNFPFWQVLRFAIPTLFAGNTIIVKHAENVPQCALAIEEIFLESGFEKGVYQNIFAGHEQSELILSDSQIKGLSLTGSTRAGKQLGELTGRYIKRAVFELGGSDPFIVLKDVDLDLAVSNAILGRFQNNGQTCIAAKRLIIEESIFEDFTQKFIYKVKSMTIGNPMDNPDLGPLARLDLKESLSLQEDKAVNMGDQILYKHPFLNDLGCYYAPSVLLSNSVVSISRTEELFGPVAVLIKAKNEMDAVTIANQSSYGLGASIWTTDTEKALELAKEIEAGNVYINSIVKSDVHLPFGGIKDSGLGKELGKEGIRSFVNTKSIVLG